MLKKILSVTICIFAISISLFVVGIPLANNHYAEQVEKNYEKHLCRKKQKLSILSLRQGS